MRERRAWVLLHGKQAQNEAVRAAIQARRLAGWELAVRPTWEAGDARRLVKEGVAEGYRIIVAGGGDGTLRDVAEALVDINDALPADARASLLPLPLGTANDFARAAGTGASPEEALALLEVSATPVDIGDMNGRRFLNMATGGFGSQVTASTSEELKKLLGGAAYLLTGLTRFNELHAASGRFRGPNFDWQGDFLALGVGNGRLAGGGQPLCPEALVDDGLLDLCIVPATQDVAGTLRALFSGGVRGLHASAAKSVRLPWVEIEAPEGLYMNLDGEPLHETRLHLKLLPGRLPVHLPKNSPLLAVNCR